MSSVCQLVNGFSPHNPGSAFTRDYVRLIILSTTTYDALKNINKVESALVKLFLMDPASTEQAGLMVACKSGHFVEANSVFVLGLTRDFAREGQCEALTTKAAMFKPSHTWSATCLSPMYAPTPHCPHALGIQPQCNARPTKCQILRGVSDTYKLEVVFLNT